MIVALVILDSQPQVLHNKPAFLAEIPAPTPTCPLELLIGTALRGPFGVTVAAVAEAQRGGAEEFLKGYAVQITDSAGNDNLTIIQSGLAFAESARQRWEKAMQAAASRFGGGAQAVAKHKASKDVKLRGLAHSFDRDGVMLFRTRYPAISLELQAQVVEAFGRNGVEKTGRKALAQPLVDGQRGFPVLMDWTAAGAVRALPAGTDFDQWLASQDALLVPTNDATAVAQLASEADLPKFTVYVKQSQPGKR